MSRTLKIVTIVGARPQFVKAAVLSRHLALMPNVQELIVHTGQHFDEGMSEVFFREMEIPAPSYRLDINGLSHGAMTGQMMEAIEEILIKEKPDCVVVYGDTNSTLAGALAAKKLHIKVAHVEAGLRSFNLQMPEEINRILTDRIADILFVPTDSALLNLKKEGFDNFEVRIEKTGDVMQDAALYYARKMEGKISSKVAALGSGFVLATMHRAENTDNAANLSAIVSALNTISEVQKIVLPLHPRTKKALEKHGLQLHFETFDPLGYFDMLYLLQHCDMVMTDSGGLQKEAFFFGKNCVTLRDETEWIELVEGGFNALAPANAALILKQYRAMKNKQNDFNVNLYGMGEAGAEIAKVLISFLA